MAKVINYTPNFCKCGAEPVMVQWEDTLKPNATWIECKSCGMMTKTYYDKVPLKAKEKALKAWNKKAKTRKKLENGFKSCEKCGSEDVVFEVQEFVSFSVNLLQCQGCGLILDSMDEEGHEYTKKEMQSLWNK